MGHGGAQNQGRGSCGDGWTGGWPEAAVIDEVPMEEVTDVDGGFGSWMMTLVNGEAWAH
jgi:hypothetical protein